MDHETRLIMIKNIVDIQQRSDTIKKNMIEISQNMSEIGKLYLDVLLILKKDMDRENP
jgi:hypothetical protein